jgi:hemerythrin
LPVCSSKKLGNVKNAMNGVWARILPGINMIVLSGMYRQLPDKYNPAIFEISQEDMMELAWTEQLSVGNALIDSEHKRIVDMVNSVEHALTTSDRTDLSRLLKLLLEGMHNHFINERNIARAIEFPFAEHDLSHQYILKKLQHAVSDVAAENKMLPEGFVEQFTGSLRGWLVDHVIKEDMLMKPVLDTYPYDFNPG